MLLHVRGGLGPLNGPPVPQDGPYQSLLSFVAELLLSLLIFMAVALGSFQLRPASPLRSLGGYLLPTKTSGMNLISNGAGALPHTLAAKAETPRALKIIPALWPNW